MNLLNDVHPGFATAEQAYIAEFNVERNGYDERVGPCFHKRILVDPQAHRSGWVPLEEIHEKDLHPDIFTLPASYDEDEDAGEDYDVLFGTFDETCEASGPWSIDYDDKYADMARRFGCYDTEEQPLEMSRETVINLFHAHDDFNEDGEVEGVDTATMRRWMGMLEHENVIVDDSDDDVVTEPCLCIAQYGYVEHGLNPISSYYCRRVLCFKDPKRNRGRKRKTQWSALPPERQMKREMTLH